MNILELFGWLEKRGWKPNWHDEPQDSVDFTMSSMQNYLRRLVQGEAAIGDQVEDRRKQLELAEKLEATGDYSLSDSEEEILNNIVYEDSEEGGEFDDDALN